MYKIHTCTKYGVDCIDQKGRSSRSGSLVSSSDLRPNRCPINQLARSRQEAIHGPALNGLNEGLII